MAITSAKIASELLGLGSVGGGLEKLTIRCESGARTTSPIEALFNPSEISISKSVTYDHKIAASKGDASYFAIKQRLRTIEAATLSIELFFDSYEYRSDAFSLMRVATSLIPTNPFQSSDATDVTRYTQQIARLAEVDTELHRPPICSLHWGHFRKIFEGVLINLEQRFTMFLADGTPVRATLSCTFAEHTTEARTRANELHSADVNKTRQVRRNDTLHSLAAEEYNDPRLWRLIAKANGIVNPRNLKLGAVLIIPKLQS